MLTSAWRDDVWSGGIIVHAIGGLDKANPSKTLLFEQGLLTGRAQHRRLTTTPASDLEKSQVSGQDDEACFEYAGIDDASLCRLWAE